VSRTVVDEPSAAPGGDEPPAGVDAPAPRRRRRVWPWVGVVLLAGAAVAGWVVAAQRDGSGEAPEAKPLETATVERRDLLEHELVPGTLVYDDARTLTGTLPGTVTWLPEEGSIVRRGDEVLRVDDRPVVLLYGDVPAWRPLGPSVSDGADVLALERNLAALGFTDGDLEVDREWDWRTTEAVEDWQDSLGLDDTGTVELGRVVFLPERRRVAAIAVEVGSPAVGPLLQTTVPDQVVEVPLDASLQDIAEVGAPVTVTLPDDREVAGRVTAVGAVAEASPDGTASVIPVTVRLEGRVGGIRRFDQAPVSVELVKDSKRDVLAVPVASLVALAEGGFAVEVPVAGGGTQLVAVEPGMYSDDGWVEVTGDLAEGDQVVLAA
jgi:hypothetical protein